MKAKISITPRKRPKQERSRATVEAILDATARVVVRDGFDTASTNQIARVAGVSVGSLYQYFPNKESLVAALVERNLEGIARELREGLAATAEAPLSSAVRELVRRVMAFHADQPELHRVLAEQIPRNGRVAASTDVSERVVALALEVLAERRHELRSMDVGLGAFIIAETIEGLIQAALMSNPALFENEGFIEEVSLLITRYVEPDSSAAARQPC